MVQRSTLLAGGLLYYLWFCFYNEKRLRKFIRSRLPKDLDQWRDIIDLNLEPGNVISQAYKHAWISLQPVLEERGLRLWNVDWGRLLRGKEKEFPAIDNYFFIGPEKKQSFANVHAHCVWNGLAHAASRTDKRDFILRMMTAGGQGHEHLSIIQRLSSAPDIFEWNNHILPMVDQIVFEDITIGVFPRLQFNIQEVSFVNRQVSVEDILYVILQALEGIVHIHKQRIAHRDLFSSNILVEWCPESIKEGRSVTRPRVYLIDFETAIEFPENSLESERLCVGINFDKGKYARQLPEEVKLEGGSPYNPFCLDIWQFGFDLKRYFPMDIPEISQLWDDMNAPLAQNRPTALQAIQRLSSYVGSVPPSALHVLYVNPQIKRQEEL